jgi:precorrin-6A/cobalt-precorrin-6A reductase
MTGHVLLLAGTEEARALAGQLRALSGIRVTASLAGATRTPSPLGVPTRTGGFGGSEGLARYLRDAEVAALIDATHPFARQMAANAAQACAATGVPRLKLLRPAWGIERGWTVVSDIAAAAKALPAGARAFLTTGSKETAPFAARLDVSFVLRVIEPVVGLPPHIRQIVARPPFALEAERALMVAESVTHLVTKNAGGSGRAKLDAAREQQIPVVMIERPAPPNGPVAATIADAVAWVTETVANHR